MYPAGLGPAAACAEDADKDGSERSLGGGAWALAGSGPVAAGAEEL